MPNPSPSRNYPDPDDTSSPLSGGAFLARNAANSERLYDMVISHLGSIGGSADAITASCTPPTLADPVDGQTFRLVPAANNTTAAAITIDGRGPFDIRTQDGSPLDPDTLVASIAADMWMDETAGYLRLSSLSLNEAIEELAGETAAASLWELLGDTTVSTAVANIEHLFTAGDYSLIKMVLSGISGSAGADITATLRNSSGAIVSLAATVGAASVITTGNVEFNIDLVSATKVHFGSMALFGSGGTGILTSSAGGTSATAPDRVRLAMSSGNLDAGRVLTYGLKKPS